MNVFGWLNDQRRALWKILSGGKIISAISHFVLVVGGTLPFAYLAYGLTGSRAWAIIVGSLFAEFWSHFMLSRETLDYCKHKAKGHDMDWTWQDGLGDLAGPFLNRLVWWLAMLWLILGGG